MLDAGESNNNKKKIDALNSFDWHHLDALMNDDSIPSSTKMDSAEKILKIIEDNCMDPDFIEENRDEVMDKLNKLQTYIDNNQPPIPADKDWSVSFWVKKDKEPISPQLSPQYCDYYPEDDLVKKYYGANGKFDDGVRSIVGAIDEESIVKSNKPVWEYHEHEVCESYDPIPEGEPAEVDMSALEEDGDEDRIKVPAMEYDALPTIKFSQIKERRFNLIDRAQEQANKEWEEDTVIFSKDCDIESGYDDEDGKEDMSEEGVELVHEIDVNLEVQRLVPEMPKGLRIYPADNYESDDPIVLQSGETIIDGIWTRQNNEIVDLFENSYVGDPLSKSTGTSADKLFIDGIPLEDIMKECKKESDEQAIFDYYAKENKHLKEIPEGIPKEEWDRIRYARAEAIKRQMAVKKYQAEGKEEVTMMNSGAGQPEGGYVDRGYAKEAKAMTAQTIPMGLGKKKKMSSKSFMSGTIAAFLKDVADDFEIPEDQMPLLERYVEKSLIPWKNMDRFLAIDDIVKYNDHACVVSAIDCKDYTVSLYDVESMESNGWMRAVGLDIILTNKEWQIVKVLIQQINDVRRAEVEKKFKPGMMIRLTKDFTYQITNMFGQVLKVIIKEKTEGILVKILSGDDIKVAFYGDGVHDIEIDNVEITNPSSAAWDNVILPDNVKEQILAVAKYNKNDIDKFDVGINKEDWHGLYPHLLLYGPPGNGKTAISMALGKKIGRPVLSIKGAQCHNVSMLGETLVKAAEWNAIVFIDEFFLMSPECMSAMLTSLEQIDTPIIMASNTTEMTKAMASRIPIKLKIDFPDKDSMKEIWKIHLGQSAKNVDIDMLVSEYKQISGRDIKSAVVMSIARIAERQSQLPEVMAGMATPMITTDLLVDQLEEHKKFEEDRKSYDPNA